MKNSNKEQIFHKEEEILRAGYELLKVHQNSDQEILDSYRDFLKYFEKILRQTRKIYRISDYQGIVLKKREYALKNLLDNSNQGFLTVNNHLCVDPEYSAKCEEFFGDKIGQTPIIDLLFAGEPEQKAAMAKVLDRLFTCSEKKLIPKIIQQLPRRININDKQVDIEYKYLLPAENETEKSLMLIITDVTEHLISQARIEFLSYYDTLTSLYNRNFINQLLPNLLTVVNLPLSLILCDLNGLKVTNDIFGHEQGDQLLIEAADILKRCCRKADMVCRWGGDEFLIILPKTDQAGSQNICERINLACSQAVGDPVSASLSIGAATMERFDQQFSGIFKEAEAKMYKEKLLQSKNVKQKIIDNIDMALEKRELEILGHSERVKKLVKNFAGVLGIAEGSLDFTNLLVLAALHDIGKVIIPEEVHFKIDNLTKDDWEIIKMHSEEGYRMAHSIGEPVIADAVLCLHEWWDGSGYPNRIAGENIPFYARLFAIIDAYDIMTHDTVYKKAKNKKEALEELELLAGKQFDPTLTKLFVGRIAEIEN
ncbi:MAG: HD-GYP domain-containing protein [Peptococcaceae bacterium]